MTMETPRELIESRPQNRKPDRDGRLAKQDAHHKSYASIFSHDASPGLPENC